jgi:peptidoglycan hydrolase-like protein with peptidoglycan-binding domain
LNLSSPGRLVRGGPAFSFRSYLGRGFSRRVLFVSVVALALVSPVLADQSTQPSNPAPASKTATKKKKSSGSRSRRQMAPEPARIKEIQQALGREGFYQGEPTGKWDDATIAAMKNFQQFKGLPATGKIEALSLQKLGLGSSVAGLAPPTPAAPAAAPSPNAPQKP